MMKFIKKRVLAVVSLFLVLTLLPVLPKTMAVSQGKMISQTREQLDAERYIVTTLYDTIKAKWAGNVVLTAFPAFSVTNLLLVQCSSAVLQCSCECIRAHPFPLIYAP